MLQEKGTDCVPLEAEDKLSSTLALVAEPSDTCATREPGIRTDHEEERPFAGAELVNRLKGKAWEVSVEVDHAMLCMSTRPRYVLRFPEERLLKTPINDLGSDWRTCSLSSIGLLERACRRQSWYKSVTGCSSGHCANCEHRKLF